MTAPTLVGPRVTLRAFRHDDRAARQRHGWHREIERGYGSDCPTRPMTDDEVEAWAGHGRWHDDVVMGVLDREFAASDAARVQPT